ncbi:hypothetical protein ACLB2K_025421 [Fragaria x ananassa]
MEEKKTPHLFFFTLLLSLSSAALDHHTLLLSPLPSAPSLSQPESFSETSEPDSDPSSLSLPLHHLDALSSNREREKETAGVKMDRDMYGQPRESSHVQQEAKPGVIGSVFRAVTGTLEHAKDAVVGKSHDDSDAARERSEYTTLKAKETTDAAGEKLDEYKEAAAQSAKEAADRTAQKTMAMKDTTAQKAKETVDKARETKESAKGNVNEYAAEKAKETKDTTEGKAKVYTNYAADKAKEAKGTTVGKANEYTNYVADKAKEAKDTTVEKAKEAKDTTVEKTKETAEAAKNKTNNAAEYTAEKAKEGKDTTLSKLGGLMNYFTGKKEDTKEKLSLQRRPRLSKRTLNRWPMRRGRRLKRLRRGPNIRPERQPIGQSLVTLQETLSETEEESRRKMEELRLRRGR